MANGIKPESAWTNQDPRKPGWDSQLVKSLPKSWYILLVHMNTVSGRIVTKWSKFAFSSQASCIRYESYRLTNVLWIILYDSEQEIMQLFLYQGKGSYSRPRYLHKITFRNENQDVQWYLHRVPSDYSSLKMQQFEFHARMHFQPCVLLFH